MATKLERILAGAKCKSPWSGDRTWFHFDGTDWKAPGVGVDHENSPALSLLALRGELELLDPEPKSFLGPQNDAEVSVFELEDARVNREQAEKERDEARAELERVKVDLGAICHTNMETGNSFAYDELVSLRAELERVKGLVQQYDIEGDHSDGEELPAVLHSVLRRQLSRIEQVTKERDEAFAREYENRSPAARLLAALANGEDIECEEADKYYRRYRGKFQHSHAAIQHRWRWGEMTFIQVGSLVCAMCSKPERFQVIDTEPAEDTRGVWATRLKDDG